MNLGSLTTMARYGPPNLIHVVFDNEVLLSVGESFTTATASGSDIAAMAAAAGIPRTSTIYTVEVFQQTFRDALQAGELTTLVAKVTAEGPLSYLVDVHMLENRFAFQRYLASPQPPAGMG
jgi:sulfopyruvate decarboxylase subunit beta